MCDIPYGNIAELDTEEWKKAIRDASRLGAQTIVFSGGEPLLRDDIFDLIAFARANNLNACVTSNGHLIDEQVAGKLSLCGVNVVNISVEGKKDTHDHLRGAGSFDKAAAALDNLRKYKIESTVASTVSKYNYKDLLFVLGFAQERGATTVRLQPFNVIFLRDHKRKAEFLINRNEVGRLEGIIKDFIRLSGEYKIAVNPAGYLMRIPQYLNGKNFYPESCGALWYSCPINPNGDLFPCWIEGSNNKLIGNIKTEGLYNLWLSERRIKVLKSIAENGCSGCLMSCYDEAFDRRLLKESIIFNAKRISKIKDYRKIATKLLQNFKGQATRMKLRYKFYASYRGSFPGVIARRVSAALGRVKPPKQVMRNEREIALAELARGKERLRKTMRTL
jgi:radical SAM protein with 4Fe4S-binding SPASM domain